MYKIKINWQLLMLIINCFVPLQCYKEKSDKLSNYFLRINLE